MKLAEAGGYDPQPQARQAVPRDPVRMEETPDPAAEPGLGPED